MNESELDSVVQAGGTYLIVSYKGKQNSCELLSLAYKRGIRTK
jgi:hypothetical protein